VQEQQHSPPADVASSAEQAEISQTGFGARGRARRRARFLRKARELAYRDLGGLVFNLHRFAQRNDPLVVAKLSMLDRIDAELRALEGALRERQPVTVLREAGITACPRCAAIHGSEDNFCPNCGLAMGRHADLPIDLRSVAGSTAATQAAVPQASAPTPTQGPPPPQAPAPPPSQAPVAAPTVTHAVQASPEESEPTEIIRPSTVGM
jgi:hypothetical protein